MIGTLALVGACLVLLAVAFIFIRGPKREAAPDTTAELVSLNDYVANALQAMIGLGASTNVIAANLSPDDDSFYVTPNKVSDWAIGDLSQVSDAEYPALIALCQMFVALQGRPDRYEDPWVALNTITDSLSGSTPIGYLHFGNYEKLREWTAILNGMR